MGLRSRGHRGFVVPTCAVVAMVLTSGCDGTGGDGAATGRRLASRGSALVTGPSPGGPTCSSSDIHATHQTAGFACTVCHPCGGQYGFTSVYQFPSGQTSTAGGTITPGNPTTQTQTSCTVACHYPLGTPAHSISWNAGQLLCTSCHAISSLVPVHPAVSPDATRADCQVCHIMTSHMSGTPKIFGHDPNTWMDQTSPGFHAYTANAGIAYCQQCHLPDLSGGITNVACAQCHDQNLPPGVTTWKQNCFMCHGDNVNYANGGAPPRTTWGQSGDAVRIGAHTSHIVGSAIAPAFDCGVCHVKPADALSQGHIDQPTATVTFAGLAVVPGGTLPTWDRTSATCASTYCHGASLSGGGNKTPIWTKVGQGQADCGTCHGVPPPPPHQFYDTTNGYKACNPCHFQTIDANGVLIPPSAGGKHLDGVLQAVGHDSTWMDQASPNVHAYSANRGLGGCTGCHGADLSGGSVGVACAQCHDQNLPPGISTWKQNCFMCHGDNVNYTFGGAPPRTTWGNSGDPIRASGHQTSHLSGRMAVAYDCDACHVKPTDAFSPGHIDNSVATVTFGGIAVTGGATPFWNRDTASCSSVYCHGNYTGTYYYTVWDWGADAPIAASINYAGKNASPNWLDGPMACDSCHGGPPQNGPWHMGHVLADGCQQCHPDAAGGNYMDSSKTATYPLRITNPPLHANGRVEVTPLFVSRCFNCH